MTVESVHEEQDFKRLQERLWPVYAPDPDPGPRTFVVVPSVTLDAEELRKIPGAIHYEERLLFTLQMLRHPQTRIVYVTNRPLAPAIVEYAFDVVSSLPYSHARRRLTLLDCGDGEAAPLTGKLLSRPELLDRIRREIRDGGRTALLTYNSTSLERTLALRLGIPLYACNPALADLGSKSGSRRFFRAAGVAVPDGYEDLRDENDLISALAQMKSADPALNTAVVKLDDSFAGGGNALFSYAGAPDRDLETWIAQELPSRIRFGTGTDTWESYTAKWRQMGGIAERYVEAKLTRSPAAQLDITPQGEVRVLGTHDQILGGSTNQIFVASSFPALEEYRPEIHELAERSGKALAERGVVGLLSIDFVSERTDTKWCHYGLELNLRMGGGTTPYYYLNGLVGGEYRPESAEYVTPDGQPRCYMATDRLQRDEYRIFSPDDLIDLGARHGLLYDNASRTGAMFYMLGGTSNTGKVGVIAVHRTPQQAQALYDNVVKALDTEVAGSVH